MFTFFKGKKGVIFLVLLSILLPIIVISYGYIKNISIKNHLWNNNTNISEIENKESIIELDDVSMSINKDDGVITSGDTIVYRRYIYNLCNHSSIDDGPIWDDDIGLNRKEFSDRYSGWHIRSFNTRKIVMEKIIHGYCSQHYIVRGLDGYIVIYQPDMNGNLEIIKQTDIPIEYLPQDLQHQIEEGLVVDTLEEIEHMIEDLDS